MPYQTKEKYLEYQREYQRKYQRQDHVRAAAKLRYKRYQIKKKYGLTEDQYKSLIEATNGKCPVCSRDFGKRGPFIDHCHSTDMVRGVLCHNCNSAEGLLGSPDNVLNLYKYMIKNHLFYQGGN